MTKELLKQAVIDAIDADREKIIHIGETVATHPELGYREFRTTTVVRVYLESLGLSVENSTRVTGTESILNPESKGPTIALLGELDAIIVPDHPDANAQGVVHACGHHIQLGGMLGAVTGLVNSGVLDHLDGRIKVLTTPAEEFIEFDYRQELKDQGMITYFSGKQEMIRLGIFDDVDMSMMFHSLGDLGEDVAIVGPNSNGFLAKRITFTGKAAHAGSAPETGINALNAATLALMNIHAQREVFKDSDRIRVHSIITRGGDVVNVVPAEVKMESCVRARTLEALFDASKKVDRALVAGAYAVGAELEIKEDPGYLPILRTEALDLICKENIEALGYEGRVRDGGDFTCSFDFGDISHLMPSLHPMIGGVRGALHTKDFMIDDVDLAYIMPAKALAMSIIDLLYDGAVTAHEIIDAFNAPMTKESYLAYLEDLRES